MTAFFAILRFALPLLIFVVMAVLFWRRFKRAGQPDRIDVDAKVVNSEPTKVSMDEYEPSEVYVKKQPYQQGDTKESQ
ncbi:MAG: hypothetical protein FWE96_04575 [Coriobacteriia bacterium]|nr:hypothetical protein [Coriobacteriia bacterium]